MCRQECTWDGEKNAWRHSRTLSNQSVRSESSPHGDDEGKEQEDLVGKEQEDWYWHATDGTWRKGLDDHGPELSYEDVLEMDEEQHTHDRNAAKVKRLQSDILHLEDELDEMAPEAVAEAEQDDSAPPRTTKWFKSSWKKTLRDDGWLEELTASDARLKNLVDEMRNKTTELEDLQRRVRMRYGSSCEGFRV